MRKEHLIPLESSGFQDDTSPSAQVAGLSFAVVTDFSSCERLWKELIPEETLFDLWEYRLCFFDEDRYEPYFILGSRFGKNVGVLPLWKDRTDETFEFFGDQLTTNRFPIVSKELVSAFMAQLPPKTYLWFMEDHHHPHLRPGETSFYLDLCEYGHSLERYLASFGKKHRKNLRRDLKQLEERGYVIHHNRLGDYGRMVELNRKRFGEDSFFAGDSFTEGFSRLISLAEQNGSLRMISIEVDGKVEAVEAGVQHKGVYYVLMGGNNLDVPNIGKLMIVEHIKHAIRSGADVVDFLTDDCGWKRLWNLREKQMYEYHNGK
jgi:hypothetical protein